MEVENLFVIINLSIKFVYYAIQFIPMMIIKREQLLKSISRDERKSSSSLPA